MYVIIFYVGNAALHLARLAFLDYANPQAMLTSAHASGAMQQVK